MLNLWFHKRVKTQVFERRVCRGSPTASWTLIPDLWFSDGPNEPSAALAAEEKPTQRFDLLLLWRSSFSCFLHVPQVLWRRSRTRSLCLVSWPGPTACSRSLLHERLSQLRVDRARGASAGVLPWRRGSGPCCYWREHPGRKPEDLLKDGAQSLKKDVTVPITVTSFICQDEISSSKLARQQAGEDKELPVFQTDGRNLQGNSVSVQFEIRALGHRGNNTKVQRRLRSVSEVHFNSRTET